MSDKNPEEIADDAAAEPVTDAVESSEDEETGAVSSGADSDSVSNLVASAEKVSERLESLLPGVLETAEATNSAADVSRRASSALENGLDHLQKRVNALNEASEKSAQLASRVLVGAVSALVLSVVVYGFIAFQLAARVSQVDSMLVAVSKRVVQMNSALETFEQIRFSINQLAARQAEFADRQMLLVESVSRTEVSARSLITEVPGLAAQQVGEKTDQVVAQVSILSDDLQGQGAVVAKLSSSVGALGKQMQSLERRVGNVQKLNADVEALITLEREKYLDVLERQVAVDEARQAEGQPPVEPPKPSIVVYPFVSEKQ